ncbi:hypothetical protein CEXT_300821 [Caerostris extrusa]|uniref:Uncharacterized protein n=1 Tax=Caerostris extrusa TaxID=172846 RepID=A0AAV4MS45_CAEEX|nr:hypothetical protein CEXT_300821 [Caerostris extrusa]
MPAAVDRVYRILWDHSSACITVDITSERFTSKNYRTNKWIFRNQSKLPFPYRGKYSLDSARAKIQQLYSEKDAGRGLYVGSRGTHKKDFFESCGLPVCEIKTDACLGIAPSTTSCRHHLSSSTNLARSTWQAVTIDAARGWLSPFPGT